MSISFIAVRGDANSGWEVVKKTVAMYCNYSVEVISNRSKDKNLAEVGARKVAELAKLPFFTSNKSVVTVVSFGSSFVAMEITPDKGVIGRGITTADINEAIADAKVYAEKEKHHFLNPAT